MLTAVVTQGLADRSQRSSPPKKAKTRTTTHANRRLRVPTRRRVEANGELPVCRGPIAARARDERARVGRRRVHRAGRPHAVLALPRRQEGHGRPVREHPVTGTSRPTHARAAARAEVAEYESALATVKAEAHERVDAARHDARGRAHRTPRRGQRRDRRQARSSRRRGRGRTRRPPKPTSPPAVADVTTRTVELATGKVPDAGRGPQRRRRSDERRSVVMNDDRA